MSDWRCPVCGFGPDAGLSHLACVQEALARLPKLWLLFGQTCAECNRQGVRLLDHAPTVEDRDALSSWLGGGWCVSTHTAAIKVSDDPVELEDTE
jgi:hypothetical protein